MKFIICGIPRSGSTLVWQIMQAIFADQKILQTHPVELVFDGSFAIATIRHPCDVAASRYRIRLSRGGIKCGGASGLEAELVVMKTHFDALSRIRDSLGKLLWYEDFYQDYTVIYRMIQEEFHCNVSCLRREELDRLFSATANKERADKLNSFNEIDEQKIHGDHIGPVVPGAWTKLPDWQKDAIQEFCLPIADEWGYTI